MNGHSSNGISNLHAMALESAAELLLAGSGEAHETKPQRVLLDGSTTIGRQKGHAVVLQSKRKGHETMISRKHAVISYEPSTGWRIEDQNSLNGLLVNGRRTKAAPLRDGDSIGLGDSHNVCVTSIFTFAAVILGFRLRWAPSIHVHTCPEPSSSLTHFERTVSNAAPQKKLLKKLASRPRPQLLQSQ